MEAYYYLGCLFNIGVQQTGDLGSLGAGKPVFLGAFLAGVFTKFIVAFIIHDP
jgi:hypothetical protein